MPASLRNLNTAISEIHASLSPRHVIDIALKWSKTLLHCKAGAIFLPHHSSEGLKVYFHLPTCEPEQLKTSVATNSQSLENWIISSGKPQIIHNNFQKNLLKKTEIPALEPIHNLMALPLKHKTKPIGVLEVMNHRTHSPFSPKQLHFLEMLGQQIATALHNAQVYSAQQAFAKEQKRQISSTTEQLRSANEKLRETDKTKSESISMIAHELRSPITSIAGFAKILYSGNTGPLTRDQKEFCGIIQKNTENIDRLVGDLLDMTKLELGKLVLHFDILACRELLKEAFFSIRGISEKDNERIHLRLPEEKMFVSGDRLRLVQVLVNLLTNALKYSPTDKPIRAYYFSDETHITFAIEDQGTPLSAEQQQKVFEKFYRVKNSTIKTTGSGLGLAISKIILEKHDGKIWAETLPGPGNRFCFRLKKIAGPVVPPL
ncbi:GAF domain-containing protein [bacterium]|nr:GAF domain-containing protein [bacterium]